MPPLFSVVIPAHNAGKTLPACLESIKAMHMPAGGFELLVVDDGSTDDTMICAAKYGAMIIVRTFDCVAAVRNAGAAAARGIILAFLDADMIVDPDWLHHAEAHYFSRRWNGILSYSDHAPQSAGWIGGLWNDPDRRSSHQGAALHFMPTRNLLVSADTFKQSGGFDERLFAGHRTGEDKEFTWRLRKSGIPLMCDQSLDMIHLGWERNLKELLRKERWRQGATLLMAARHGWNVRLLRAPAFAALHAVSLLTLLIGLILLIPLRRMGMPLSLAGMAFWIFPSLAISVRSSGGRLSLSKLCGVWILSFLRWSAAATTLPAQAVTLINRQRVHS